jgi:hypothetical protein
MAKASTQQAGYVSNPFTVFINAFKNLGLNLGPLALLYVSSIGVVLLLVVAALLMAGVGVALKDNLPVLLVVEIPLGLVLLTGFFWFIGAWGAAYTKYGIVTSRQQTVEFKELVEFARRRAWGFIGLNLLTGLIVMLGVLLFVIPGLVFAYWFCLATYIYADQETSTVEALKASKKLVRGKFVELAGLVGAGLVFYIPAALPFVGSFYQIVYSPVTVLAWSYRYISFQSLGSSAPVRDKSNYWAIAAGAALLLIGLALMALIVIGSLQESSECLAKYPANSSASHIEGCAY